MVTRGGWGLGWAVLAMVAACSSTPKPPGTVDAGADASADVVTSSEGGVADAADAGGCGIAPRFDLDTQGIATPEGDAAWVDFSRSSDTAQLTAIPTCGGAVYNAVVVQWTAPRAGIMRLRVERDQADWASEMLAGAYLSARRLESCSWSATARECSVATFETDPSHTRSEFEFRVQAGTQWIALAWSFNYGNAGVRVTPVPPLRVSANMVAATAYGRACTPGATEWDQLCPARSDCISVAGAAATCIPRGARSGICRGPLRDCDEGLACLALGNTCEPPAAIGESCESRGCAAGASCLVRSPVSESRCVALGTLLGECRDTTDPRGACDATLTCRRVDTRLVCVTQTAVGEACMNGSFCAGLAVCAPDSARQLVCTPPGTENTPCDATSGQLYPCATGLRCVAGSCRRTRPMGEACAEEFDCDAGLACIDNRCAMPTAGRCTTRGDACPEGQRCINRTCVPAIAAGQTCTGSSCAGGLVCPSDLNRCEVSMPTTGCTTDVDCVRGTACREHLCVVVGQCPQRNVFLTNVVCDANSRCIPVAAGGLVCRPIGHDGGVCRQGPDAPCDAGFRCVGGVCAAAADAAAGVCADRLRCPPGMTCDAGCKLTGAAGTEGSRCRRARNGAGECDRPLTCNLATLTCVR